MSSLLISVQNLREAEDALRGGADIVDFKNPVRGALAPVDPLLWRQASSLKKLRLERSPRIGGESRVHGPRPDGLASKGLSLLNRPALSAALGEFEEAHRVAASVPASFTFAKAGPSGCRSPSAIKTLWQSVGDELPNSVDLVAVAYADHAQANCLAPEVILRLAHDAGLRWVLIDTFVKRGRSSIQHLGWHRLRQLAESAARHQMALALAGTIRREDRVRCHAHGLRVDCYGVRGDVCTAGRAGQLDLGRVKRWKRELIGSKPNLNP